MELCTRKDVPVNETWDLSLIFASEELMWKALNETKDAVKKFSETYSGQLNTAEKIVNCLDEMEPILVSVSRIWSYSGLALEAE